MFKLSILAFLLVFIVPTLASTSTTPEHVMWANSRNTGSDTIITLRFFLHDIYGGKKATDIQVANPGGLDKSRHAFGGVVVADNFLTESPNINSKLIGRAQGFSASASMQETGLMMAFTLAFTDGIYKGSSFTITGLSRLQRATREIPVVGGTGQFRWARGFAIMRTHNMITDGPTTTFTGGFNVTLVIPNNLKNIT